MSLNVTRHQLLADKTKVDSFVKEIVDMLLLSLESLDEKHPILQFGRVFRDFEVVVTVSLLRDEERGDYEPGSGHPTLQP